MKSFYNHGFFISHLTWRIINIRLTAKIENNDKIPYVECNVSWMYESDKLTVLEYKDVLVNLLESSKNSLNEEIDKNSIEDDKVIVLKKTTLDFVRIKNNIKNITIKGQKVYAREDYRFEETIGESISNRNEYIDLAYITTSPYLKLQFEFINN